MSTPTPNPMSRLQAHVVKQPPAPTAAVNLAASPTGSVPVAIAPSKKMPAVPPPAIPHTHAVVPSGETKRIGGAAAAPPAPTHQSLVPAHTIPPRIVTGHSAKGVAVVPPSLANVTPHVVVPGGGSGARAMGAIPSSLPANTFGSIPGSIPFTSLNAGLICQVLTVPEGKWVDAKVIRVDRAKNRIFIGYAPSYISKVWIQYDEGRVAMLGTH